MDADEPWRRSYRPTIDWRTRKFTCFSVCRSTTLAGAALELVDQETPRSVLAAVSLAQATIAQNTVNYKAELISSEGLSSNSARLATGLVSPKRKRVKGTHCCFLGVAPKHRDCLRRSEVRSRIRASCRLFNGLTLATTRERLGGCVVAARRYVGEALLILHALGEEANAAYALADWRLPSS